MRRYDVNLLMTQN